MDHRSIANHRSRKSPPALAAILATATMAFGWTASGTVKSTTGTPLSGVAVTVKDSGAYSATTGSTGAFSLGSPTGIRWESAASRWGVRMVGGEMEIVAPTDGLLGLSLVDLQGRSLWTTSAVAHQGKARFAMPGGLGYGAAVLRLRQGVDEYDVAVTTGPEGTRIAKHIVAPRAMAGNPVLQFKKTGYRDTTYTMTSEMATGLSIVMAEIGGSTTCPTTKLAAGNQNKTITVKGVSRKYILHVPTGYTGSTPVPLLVDYHPIGGSASGQSGGTQYKGPADKDGAISVYPDGLTGPMGQAWNVKGCCTTADDTAFARALVAEVKTLACIDPKRVYAAGFSMGGGMTHFSACHLSDVFAAVAPAAFDLLKENVDICKPVRPLTVIMFRGTNDNVVPYAGGYSAVVSGMPINFLGAKGSFEKWASLNKCTGSPSAQDGNGCSTYSNCADGVQVTLCTKQGGGHDQGNGAVGWPLLKKYTLP